MVQVDAYRFNNPWFSFDANGSVLKDKSAPWSNYQNNYSSNSSLNLSGGSFAQGGYGKNDYQGWNAGGGLFFLGYGYFGGYIMHAGQQGQFSMDQTGLLTRDVKNTEDKIWTNYSNEFSFGGYSLLAGLNLGLNSIITDANGPLQRRYQRLFADLGLRTGRMGELDIFRNIWFGIGLLDIGQKYSLDSQQYAPSTKLSYYFGWNTEDLRYRIVTQFSHNLFNKDMNFNFGFAFNLVDRPNFNMAAATNYELDMRQGADPNHYVSAVLNFGFLANYGGKQIADSVSGVDFDEVKNSGNKKTIELYELVLRVEEKNSQRLRVDVPMIANSEQVLFRIYAGEEKRLVFTTKNTLANYNLRYYSVDFELPALPNNGKYYYNFAYLDGQNRAIREESTFKEAQVVPSYNKSTVFYYLENHKVADLDLGLLNDSDREQISRYVKRFHTGDFSVIFTYYSAEKRENLLRMINGGQDLLNNLENYKNKLKLNNLNFKQNKQLDSENENKFFDSLVPGRTYRFISGLNFQENAGVAVDKRANQQKLSRVPVERQFKLNFYGGARTRINSFSTDDIEFIFGAKTAFDF